MTEPENATTETATDNDVEQAKQSAPAGDDEQEAAIDAFVAGDEDDTPDGGSAEGADSATDGQ